MQPDNLLSFEEFQRQVGAATPTVRAALRVLRLQPVTRFSDRRFKGYRPEWVEQVKEWIQANLAR